MMISVEKGQYGQWIVTAEVSGHSRSKQYYGYSKKEATSLSRHELKEGTFPN